MSGLLYSLALMSALGLSAPWWLARMLAHRKYREGFCERLGLIPARLARPARGQQVIWIHAVSVGEVLAVSRLAAVLRERSGCRVYISTTTRTGQRLARERFGRGSVFYYPLDFAFAVRRWLRVLRPSLLVLVESELWPRMLVECSRARIPVAVVNARISDRSWPRYRRLQRLWRRLLARIPLVLAQSQADAARLRSLGAPVVRVTGNLKYDVRSARASALVRALRTHLPPPSDRAPVIVCGSTLEGEEAAILAAAPPGSVLLLAPRHPERFSKVAALLSGQPRPWHRRSAWVEHPVPVVPGSIFLVDSIGELASLYSLATLAFVGGSLVPAGGHNPLEPAQFAVPTIMGPHYSNFRGIVGALLAEQALVLADTQPDDPSQSLAAAFNRLLADPVAACALGARSRSVFERESGATERTLEALLALLPAAEPLP